MSKRTYAENVALVEQRLAGKSDAEQWFEINTMQLRESYLSLAAKVKELEQQLAQERQRCAGIVAEYVKEMQCEHDESLLKECVKEITGGE